MFGLQKPSHLFAYLLIVFPVAGLAESSQPPARRLSLQSATDALINKNLTVSLDSSLQVGSSNITSLPDQVLDTIEGDLDLQPVSMGIEEIRDRASPRSRTTPPVCRRNVDLSNCYFPAFCSSAIRTS